MLADMLDYYRMIVDNNVNIIYSGPIWAEGIEGIGGTLRKRLEFDELPLSASQSVFSVFVEQMNNMLMYSAEKEMFETKKGSAESERREVSKGLFILGSRDKKYFVQSGNVIRESMVEFIRSRIDHLNSLDKVELRKFYKEQMKSENLNPESRGAGLGMIEIARRASSKIEYSFVPYSAGQTFFSMYVTIG